MASDFFLTNHTLFVVSTGRKRLGRGWACSLTAPGVRGTREESSTAAPSSTYRAAVHENDSGPGYGEMLMSSLGRQREGCGVLKSKHWEDKTQGVFFTMHKGEKIDRMTSILTICRVYLKIQKKFMCLEKESTSDFAKRSASSLITAG